MVDGDRKQSNGEVIFYRTEDGAAEVSLRAFDGTVWLDQLAMAELFQTTIPNITQHVKKILAEGELDAPATIKQNLIVRKEGSRCVSRPIFQYNLSMILAVGYRVRSPRGTQFRQWATRHLAEYLAKGFLMDDERLKNPQGWDYYDELLARIRDIRASEKRFYQKVRELLALSVDYADDVRTSQLFFAETQNKLLYAVTGKTAAEIVVARADPAQPNMALTAWSGSRVRKHDVIVAKNYLSEDEVDSLNRLTVIFLEQAELRVKERKQLSLTYWRENVDRLLAFNDKRILQGQGAVSHDAMKTIAETRYEEFDEKRRARELRQSEEEDIRELEEAEREIERKIGK